MFLISNLVPYCMVTSIFYLPSSILNERATIKSWSNIELLITSWFTLILEDVSVNYDRAGSTGLVIVLQSQFMRLIYYCCTFQFHYNHHKFLLCTRLLLHLTLLSVKVLTRSLVLFYSRLSVTIGDSLDAFQAG